MMGEEEKAELGEEEEKDMKEVLSKLSDLVVDLSKELKMQDWKFRVFYSPVENPDNVADVSYSIHKEADITFYDYRPDYVRRDMMHEMLHCKVGRIGRQYSRIIKRQHKLLMKMAEEAEEVVIDDIIDMYDGKSDGKRRRS
jgi:hypothetical protein